MDSSKRGGYFLPSNLKIREIMQKKATFKVQSSMGLSLSAGVEVERSGQLPWCQGSASRARAPAGGRWSRWGRPGSQGRARSSGAGTASCRACLLRLVARGEVSVYLRRAYLCVRRRKGKIQPERPACQPLRVRVAPGWGEAPPSLLWSLTSAWATDCKMNCRSEELDRALRKVVGEFRDALRNSGGDGLGQMSLEFYQKKKSRWPFSDECIPWEVWTVKVHVVALATEQERQICREKVGEKLCEKIINIVEVMNRHEYLPKMPTQSEVDNVFDTGLRDVQPYLYKISFQITDALGSSVTTTMRRLIKDTLAL
uniref:Autophagy-related protein 101 n=1 Tax=Capra hircus TaxID=9925 RepID=A0A8C2S221_CAPHI